MRFKWSVLLLVITLLPASCTVPMSSTTVLHQPGPGTVQHVVLMWMKNPENEDEREKIIDATNSLREIPGILSIVYGRPIPSTRPVVDSSFHIGIVIVFRNQQAAKEYETNPIHQKAVKEALGPLIGRLQVYDILTQ